MENEKDGCAYVSAELVKLLAIADFYLGESDCACAVTATTTADHEEKIRFRLSDMRTERAVDGFEVSLSQLRAIIEIAVLTK
jgi:hypothetical protein